MSARDNPQLNIRLTPELREVLDAAAFVRSYGTASKLATEMVEDAVRALAEDTPVQAAIAARRSQVAKDADKVADIEQAKARRTRA